MYPILVTVVSALGTSADATHRYRVRSLGAPVGAKRPISAHHDKCTKRGLAITMSIPGATSERWSIPVSTYPI